MRELRPGFHSLVLLLALALPVPGIAAAAEHEIRMLNRGEAGVMVFEPAYLEIAPGDTVHFRATDRGHNAASIGDMLPPGAAPWQGGINQDFSVTFEAEGVHGVRCVPHYTMGMVALIVVGDPSANLAEASQATHPGQADERMSELLARME